MAFAIPVLRKDYVLYSQQRMAPLSGNHGQNSHNHNTTNPGSPHLSLTNVRRQAHGKPTLAHVGNDGRRWTMVDSSQRCGAASTQPAGAEKSAKSGSSPPLPSLHQVKDAKACEKVDEKRQRPMPLVDTNAECAKEGERNVEGDSGHGSSVDSSSACTASPTSSTASERLDDMKTLSVNASENLVSKPHGTGVSHHVMRSKAPATTSLSLSAPPSPSLSTPMTIRPRLRSERISIRLLENDDEEDEVFKDGDGNLRRHVHFGFCEQIEYEDDSGKKSSHAKRQQSALNRLKWLEAKLSDQFRNRGRLFRPRAFSNPVIRLGASTSADGKSVKEDSGEKKMDDLSAVFDSMGRAISAEDLTSTACKLAHRQHDGAQKRCNSDDGNLTKIGGPSPSVFRFPSFRNQQKNGPINSPQAASESSTGQPS